MESLYGRILAQLPIFVLARLSPAEATMDSGLFLKTNSFHRRLLIISEI
jgi:hypothetical protein